MELVNFINILFDIWIESSWYVALLMSMIVNASVFVIVAYTIDQLTKYAISRYEFLGYLDIRALYDDQKNLELKNGLIACFIFAVGSLATRELFSTVWPRSTEELLVQILTFSIFYETYSYFVHRLLHHNKFSKVHGVHHKSVRVTPWSAYSVHPIESCFIGFSAPLYMLLFPMSLGVALVLHIAGMVFTIYIHSNIELKNTNIVFRFLGRYPRYHSQHHISGKTNFGFVNKVWDTIFKTKATNY